MPDPGASQCVRPCRGLPVHVGHRACARHPTGLSLGLRSTRSAPWVIDVDCFKPAEALAMLAKFTKGADLSGALSGANLYGANLSGADLSGANLYGANLPGAYL